MRILVVDDDEAFCAMIQAGLEAKGHEVECRFEAVSGGEALASFRPELLIMDVDMPGGGGKALYKRLRGDPKNAELPVLVVSGTTAPGLIWEKLEAGSHPANHLHTKPVDLGKLLEWVDRQASKA